jgi:hypothetical protein
MKNCVLCKDEFKIYDGDKAFYTKMEVPEPTHCPRCRMAHLMAYRNERKLYHRKCDVTGKKVVSMFSDKSPVKMCEKNHWYSPEFDPFDYGRDFDFSKSFFENFKELLHSIPLPSLRVEHSENCEYNSDMSDSKDCYLCSRTHKSSDMLYTYRGNKSSACVDCLQVVENCEFLYECTECVTCYDSQFLEYCERCSQSAFLSNCRGCTNCMLCTNLDKKEFYFLNKQLSREEYKEKIKTFDLGDRTTRRQAIEAFEKLKKENPSTKPSIVNSEDCIGKGITNSKNCHECYEVREAVDCRYLFNIMKYSDGMDCYSGGRESELIYNATSTSASYNSKFCVRVTYSRDVDYAMFCRSCENLLGCIGIQNKKFCIFNKQYSQEEYIELREKILDHMKKSPGSGSGAGSEFGEFFPIEMSPFAYNETIAQEYFPITKEFAQKLGWRWMEEDPKEFKKQEFVVPQKVSEVDESILRETLACEQCGRNYKVTGQELSFYQKHAIPVPGKCPECRHARRFALKKTLPYHT